MSFLPQMQCAKGGSSILNPQQQVLMVLASAVGFPGSATGRAERGCQIRAWHAEQWQRYDRGWVC